MQDIINELDMVIVILTHENTTTPQVVRKENISSFQVPFEYLHEWSDQDLRAFLTVLKESDADISLEELLKGEVNRETSIAQIHTSLRAAWIDLRDQGFSIPSHKDWEFWNGRIPAVASLATLMKKVR